MSQSIPESQSNAETQFTFTTGLAPSFGKPNNREILALDDGLNTIISTTTTLLSSILEGHRQKTWEKVTEVLARCPVLEPIGGDMVKNSKDIYSLRQFSLRGGVGAPDPIALHKVRSWFMGFICDTDILGSTKIDIGWCERMVCGSGSGITSAWEILGKSEKVDKTLVDVGVLRYPTRQNPYFKVFRISLRVWAYSRPIATIQDCDNGIIGEFQYRNYKACSGMIDMLSDMAMRAATLQMLRFLGLGEDSD